MTKELFGDNPTSRQLVLSLGYALLGVVLVFLARPFEWQTLVLMIMAADILGGIVSNAASSTRAYWAAKPEWAIAAFIVIHLLEIPLIWWLAGGDIVFWALAAAMLAKIAIFWIGQDEYRPQDSDMRTQP